MLKLLIVLKNKGIDIDRIYNEEILNLDVDFEEMQINRNI